MLSFGPLLIPSGFAAFCVLVWASHIAHTATCLAQEASMTHMGVGGSGVEERKKRCGGHFSCLADETPRSGSEQWSLAWMGAAMVWGPRDLGQHIGLVSEGCSALGFSGGPLYLEELW